jgi:hypothetical protein
MCVLDLMQQMLAGHGEFSGGSTQIYAGPGSGFRLGSFVSYSNLHIYFDRQSRMESVDLESKRVFLFLAKYCCLLLDDTTFSVRLKVCGGWISAWPPFVAIGDS